MNARPIVAIPTFISAIRDSGYKTIASAVAELVDNALDAGANHVSITIRSDHNSELRPTITVVDDGCGMSPSVLQIALQFGGSTRFNSRTASGRYGMGLPCSALSLSRRVDLYSWRSPSSIWWTYLDATIIENGTLLEVPQPARLNSRTGIRTVTSSGTIVVLTDCDRVDLRQKSALSTDLKQELGRIFHRGISQGFRLSVNGEMIRSIDPLFLSDGPLPIRGKPYGPVMEFPLTSADRGTSLVKVRFSELPVEKLSTLSNTEKANQGITKGAGVSVLRAGREVDHGWFFMGSKRKENYDDWWRCEVEFEPLLDELFGLTHTKQRVNPSHALTAVLSPHIEAVARTLNRRARETFQRMATSRHSSSASRLAQRRDALLEPPSAARRSSHHDPSHADEERNPSLAITGLRYQVARMGLADSELFRPELRGTTLTMTMNTDHAFYEQFLTPPLRSGSLRSSEAIAPLELLLLAYCRAEIDLHKKLDRQIAKRIRECWGNALAAYIG
jgi:hypothetical protein